LFGIVHSLSDDAGADADGAACGAVCGAGLLHADANPDPTTATAMNSHDLFI